uniref:Protein ALP1-like n=1 Tax=Tanacetum cinerariifolium TaxID=118510 RepID=A0A6L2L477_TANCI|nr:protein ALP1-like [Tanacetum cinerariifolium]
MTTKKNDNQNAFDVDDESDIYFLQQACEYHETLVEDENRPVLTRNPIHRDRDGAEDRLMGDYFDEPCKVAGANNDNNVLDNSSLFDDLLDDKAQVALFVVNGVGYEKRYYLADGIYLQWATFVKSFTIANDAKHSYFKKRQESARKDV